MLRKTRRAFLGTVAGTLAYGGCGVKKEVREADRKTKPIRGSWFEFQHHNTAEGVYWNPACAAFSCSQWDVKVREMADIGIFDFEGEVYRSALIPAPFGRVERQLEAVSPYVDTILVYQYQGMMNKPGSEAFAGHPESTVLYRDYVSWIDETHPVMARK